MKGQAMEQPAFIFDLQRFAEDAANESAAEVPAEPATEESKGDSAKAEQPAEEPAPAYDDLAQMSQEEQLAFLKKRGVVPGAREDARESAAAEEKPEGDTKDETGKATAPEDPEYEITVDGKPMKVKLSELKNGYQRHEDYTRKTMALADERRQVDAMMAALKVGGAKAEAPKEDKPKPSVSEDYRAAVAQAEKDLGIQPGEFNQFDPEHNFALQRVIVRQGTAQAQQQGERAAVQEEVRAFVRAAEGDPLTPEVDKNFDRYLFKLGAESPESAQRAIAIAAARDRFYRDRATVADTKLLRAHWDYVKDALTKEKAATQAAPEVHEVKPEPPKTEAPGNIPPKSRAPFDARKLAGMSQKQQIAALRRAGFM